MYSFFNILVCICTVFLLADVHLFNTLACRCMMGGSNGVGQPVMANGIAPSGGGGGGGGDIGSKLTCLLQR